MSKAKFTYDESGATFFYFVLAFLFLALSPSTYIFWIKPSQDEAPKNDCRCSGCQSKQQHLGGVHKWKRSRLRFIRVLILAGWIIFSIVLYKCATMQHEYVNWDPFEILGVRENASPLEIKKAYRKLSLVYHPDKDTGDSDRFVKITKAYAALTDDEARKNWELYGNPDGPGATSFGIALPSWIVRKENSIVVLGIYTLIFMVALPVSVGLWWYQSVKFGCDKVLLNTSELYYYFIHKTPNMALKRVIMILAASCEYAKSHNPEVIERPEDNVEVPRIMRDVSMLGEKNKERPLCFSYSIKSRAIIHAHLSRMKLPQNTLEVDRCFIVKKCPYLLQEFVNCVSQLITLALSGRVQNMPNLVTLENAMKLGPMIVQALWEYQNPILQLPYFTDDTLRQLERRKIKLQTIEQLARMKESARREALKNFTNDQYEDIMHVISKMPMVQVECKLEVLDDEDPGIITAGAIVTAAVKLTRKPMGELLEKAEESKENVEELITTADTDESRVNGDLANQEGDIVANEGRDDTNNNSRNSTKQKENSGEQGNKKSDRNKGEQKQESDKSDEKGGGDGDSLCDEDEWNRKFQEKVLKKQKVFESKPKKSHSVHSPYFPEDKQEFWWVYIVDRKRFALVTAPLLVTSLVETEEVELKFTAPRVGVYSYNIVVRSDSYIDCTVQKQLRIDVKPAREYIDPAIDDPDDEDELGCDEEHNSMEDSDLLTDSDDD